LNSAHRNSTVESDEDFAFARNEQVTVTEGTKEE